MDLATVWSVRGPVAVALWPLSRLYAGLAALHQGLYRAGLRPVTRLPVPVIAVGNMVEGGAGKTPVVQALVRHLAARGIAAGIVSRGYGRAATGSEAGSSVVAVRPDSLAREVGDEPLLLARATGAPVYVAARRADAARALLARHPGTQVLVSDDGLQHWALARDLDLCVFDERGLGNGWTLPAGPLRQDWPRPLDMALAPAGVDLPGLQAPRFSLTRQLAADAVRADGTRRPLVEVAREAREGGRRVLAVAGIARPQAFFDMLADAGCAADDTRPLPDHHDFTAGPPLPDGCVLVCTEKDAVKLWPLHPQAWAVPLQVRIDPAFWMALDAWLDERLDPGLRRAARLSSNDGSQTA